MMKLPQGVKQLKNGRYRIRVTVKDPKTGKRRDHQATLEHGATLAEAVKARDELRAKIEAKLAQPTAQDQPRITVGQYVLEWETRKKRDLELSTQDRYERTINRHILPHLGHFYLDSIERSDNEDWVEWAETVTYLPKGKEDTEENRRPYGQETLNGWWGVLSNIMKDAVADGHLNRNPTYRVRAPKSEIRWVHHRETLDADTFAKFVRAARDCTPGRFPELVTALYTGMRPGELYGMHWDQVEFSRRRIVIDHAVYRGIRKKTKTGDPRTAPMVPILETVLHEHHRKCMLEQVPGFEKGIVFPSDTGGYRYPSSLQKAFEALKAPLGLEHSVHLRVLRRSFNTLMLEHGDRAIIQSIMGHTDDRMTNRYAGIPMSTKHRHVTAALPGADGGVGPKWDPDK